MDVGGGASRLVDVLVSRGWDDLTVLDISEPALAHAKARLGNRADRVRWIVADLTEWHPDRAYDVWHDRAVFQFLTEPDQRTAYLGALNQALRPGGLAILATFAPDGPEKCSGLPVRRYDAAGLSAQLGAEFRLLRTFREVHQTPGGVAQPFAWCVLERSADKAG
nr:class I SAM-dependent methyltransferase [Sediminimonas sp.]